MSINTRTRKLNKRTADLHDRQRYVKAISWARENFEVLSGLPYTTELVSDSGVYLELIVPPGTTPEHAQMALREAYVQRDVVSHAVVECPVGWFMEADGVTLESSKVDVAVYSLSGQYPSKAGIEKAQALFERGMDYMAIATRLVSGNLVTEEKPACTIW